MGGVRAVRRRATALDDGGEECTAAGRGASAKESRAKQGGGPVAMNAIPLNLLIAALGSRGDLHPMMGIAAALRARGHDVRFIIHAPDEPMIRRAGFTCDCV